MALRFLFLVCVPLSILSANPLYSFSHMYTPTTAKTLQYNGGGHTFFSEKKHPSRNAAALSPLHQQYTAHHFISGSYLAYPEENKHLISGSYSTDRIPHTAMGLRYTRLAHAPENDTLIFNNLRYDISTMYREAQDLFLYAGLSLSLWQTRDTYSAVENQDDNSEHTPYAEHVITTDISLFEFDIYNKANFALIFENVLGYSWTDNYLVRDSGGTPTDTYTTSHQWTTSGIRSLLISGTSALKLPETSTQIALPVDMRFWGPFNKEIRKETSLRERIEFMSGLTVTQQARLSLSFTYSWKSPTYSLHPHRDIARLQPQHTFSWGSSLELGAAHIHFGKSGKSWGIGLIAGF
jgi:hypothetical protein